MTHNITATGLAGIVIAASAGPALAADAVPCVPDSVIRYLAAEIPQHFRQVRRSTYLITSNDIDNLSGQLTAVILGPGELSFFDRTDPEPENWCNVANSDTSVCADYGIRLNGPGMGYLTPEETQLRFNTIIEKIIAEIRVR